MMIKKKTWNRILLAGIIFIGLVIILLVFEIPAAKDSPNHLAVGGLWIIIALHIIVLAELVYSRIFSFSEGHFENGFLVGAGFIALFLGYALSDAAFPGGPIIIFICFGCDLVTAILAFVARYYRWHLKTGMGV
jgi:ABC-type transport system involved in cytochrome c biogenesis permease component